VTRAQAIRSMNPSAQLERLSSRTPDKTAVHFAGTDHSFQHLHDRSMRLASALAHRGVGAGDRVATLCHNRVEVLEIFLAVARLGAVFVPISFRLAPAEVTYQLDDCDPAVVFADAQFVTGDQALISMLAPDRIVLVDSTPGRDLDPHIATVTQLLDRDAFEPQPVAVAGTADALILYTSGTTGRPKGAVLTHDNFAFNTVATLATLGISTSEEVWVSGLPLFHVGGINLFLWSVLSGGTLVLLSSTGFDPRAVAQLIGDAEATSCYFVPSQWTQLLDVLGPSTTFPALRRVCWGASSSAGSMLQRLATQFDGKLLFDMFGMTESLCTCTASLAEKQDHPGTVGRPMLHVDLHVVDEHDVEVPPGQVGELVYRGPTVFDRYWQQPEQTDRAFAGGWFHSGDLGRVDEDGYVYIVDRLKDMIISGGENIYSAELEYAISTHEKVRDVAVIATAHPRWVETPLAVVVPADPLDPPTLDDLVAACMDHLASFKKPTQMRVVEELPRNASGKVLKTELRQAFSTEVGQSDER